MSRIAVTIGVNRPRSPGPLKGAAGDAKVFGQWAAKQGFEVKSFNDDDGKVAFSAIFAEVQRIVDARTYTQIVIYFAGHGFQSGNSEVWLLSDAPDNASEAISVEASVMAARESGIKSVVFISDACRSIPATLQDIRVLGGSIFPNSRLARRTRPEIDRVFATLPSLVAVEAARADDAARGGGVFTREFMKGYLDPPAQFIQMLREDGRDIEVVTNRKLKELITELVEDAAADEIAAAQQSPEFILESVDAYVGKVERAAAALNDLLRANPPKSLSSRLGKEIAMDFPDLLRPTRPGASRPERRKPPSRSVASLAREAIAIAAEGGGSEAAAAATRGIGDSISDAIVRYTHPAPVDHFETATGFAVTGTPVARAASPLFPVEVLGSQLVRVQPEDIKAPSTSVLIQFAGGSGTVLPALRGYIGHIFVDAGGVTNVNYVPSTTYRGRWQDYQAVRKNVEALRAAVAAAAGLGVFRVAPGEAAVFANSVRRLKVFDPALGLYAAYAYASAGIEEEVASVLDYMHNDIHLELFDVAMLVRHGVGPREQGTAGPDGQWTRPILPFCPMLRQGWQLLAVREARLPEAVLAARDWLLPALWTTFAPEGIRLLWDVMDRGEFR